MKTDKYLKVILTIIAACLVVLTLQNLNLVPAAHAGPKTNMEAPYALVPLNADGSMDVTVKSFQDDLNVNIEKIGGYGCYNGIPVVIKQ
jgi:hypothetical protein